jgi:5-methylthioadenosine/S-adenosylhomocysteine deaminase
MSETADLLLTDGLIVTVDENNTIIENGDLAITDGRISAIGKNLGIRAKKKESLCGSIIMPGLINTHTHAAMTLLRGYSDDLPLMEWLQDIQPVEQSLRAGDVYAGTFLACLEMLKAGTTCFADMYFFEDQAAKAAIDAGIKIFAGEGIIKFPTPSAKCPREAFEMTERLYAEYKDHPLVRVCVAPHSVYLLDEKDLVRASEFSVKHNLPFMIHLSETASEVAEVTAKTGKTPVRYLNDLGLLNKNVLAVHCVCLDDEELEIFKKHNVKVSHNPESNMKLASGIAPVPEMLEKGICVGLGTDGAASNNDLCLLSEMDTAAKLHKVNKLDPTVVSARQALRMSTADAARSLGIEKETGSLEVGKAADLLVLNHDLPGLNPMYCPESHIVYAASRREVRDVYVNGKKLVSAGNIVYSDTVQAIKAVNEIIVKFKKK